jgi:TonB family protein
MQHPQLFSLAIPNQSTADSTMELNMPIRTTFGLVFLALMNLTDNSLADPPPRRFGIPHNCPHAYPRELFAAGKEGEVRVAFTISSEGLTEDVHVTQSSGHADFDNVAVACAGNWKYIPAQREGQPVATPWTAKVLFHIVPHPSQQPSELIETVVVSPE